MNNLKFNKNDLFVEGLSVKEIAKKFKTPFYCYSTSEIIEKFKIFEKPFKYSNTTICYAVKANPNIAILKMYSVCTHSVVTALLRSQVTIDEGVRVDVRPRCSQDADMSSFAHMCYDTMF